MPYPSLTFAGVRLGGLYALPSQSVSVGTGRVYALGARYSNGPLNLGIAYTNTHDLGLNGPTQAGTTFFPGLPSGPVLDFEACRRLHQRNVASCE